MTNRIINKKYTFLGLIIFLGLIVYIVAATHSGLWYDEAVEYFYSKYLIGEVPGGFGTTNMYERICHTYQPPLYNILMFCWLSIFDTEFCFRLAGIIITLIGAVGVYKTIDVQTEDGVWANIATLIYIFTASVSYYALECAEYSLMLCFLCWALFCFASFNKRQTCKSLIGFFVFSCLSVYSQYGAVFIVIGMFISVFFNICKKSDRSIKKCLGIIVILTIVCVIVPLLYFFLIPQMNSQDTFIVSHVPVFKYNFVVDYVFGILKVTKWIFTVNYISYYSVIIIIGVFLAIGLTLISLIRREGELNSYSIAIVCSWTLYYILVASSFYGYNNWNGSLGTNNLVGRYSLFFVPIIVVTLSLGVRAFYKKVVLQSSLSITFIAKLICVYAVCFCAIGVYSIDINGWEKDNVRELVDLWFESEAYKCNTFVHQWDDALFHYYLSHDERYKDEYSSNIEVADEWILFADFETMEEHLNSLGYLSEKDFFYVMPLNAYSDVFKDVVKQHGYSIEEVYNYRTALIYVYK